MFQALFQSFDEPAEGAASAPRIAALRAEIASRSLTGFIVPHADRHQNEAVPACEERLGWLTGFTGSAGMAVILLDRAVLFVDGRYTLQARQQTDGALFTIEHVDKMREWLEHNLSATDCLGYDPWLHTVQAAKRIEEACSAAAAKLVPLDCNLIDAIWTDRPPPPLAPVHLHDLRFAGESAQEKHARITDELGKLRADALVMSDPQAIAWAFNIRGGDIAFTPVPLAFAIVPRERRPSIYIDSRKLSNAVRTSLEKLADVRPPGELAQALTALGEQKSTVRLDQATGADALARMVGAAGGKAVSGLDPTVAMKALKNAIEIAGARAAHIRDGAAVVRFLAWFDGRAGDGTLTEIDAVAALESFRRETGLLKDISFPTIAGTGPHGAIVHYRVTTASNRPIDANSLFLIDSGGQYEDGTTDITRTVVVGEASPEMRARFTRVLKGHIAIARLVFPDGTTGAQLDSFARQYLWQAGLDFDHGTGHGVGSYLSVHEGPARIAKLGHAALQRGMILSNEPGYYKPDAYGIRIENLVLVVEAPQVDGAEKPLNGFETLSLAPIDRRLIERGLLSAREREWLDSYHARVFETLSSLLDAQTSDWLVRATRPLAAAC